MKSLKYLNKIVFCDNMFEKKPSKVPEQPGLPEVPEPGVPPSDSSKQILHKPFSCTGKRGKKTGSSLVAEGPVQG